MKVELDRQNDAEKKPPGRGLRIVGVSIITGVLLVALAIGVMQWRGLLDVVVGRSWPSKEQVSIDMIDHGVWNELLEKYVNDRGEVDYSAWLASSDDSVRLESYLNALSRADPTKPAERSAKLAFWINAYNALTVQGILREYPTSSIRNHTGAVGYNIWENLLIPVGGETYSLDAIEHDILRKMEDPRIHFAIVCASVGCPRLLNEAYVASRLDDQLDENARAFFAQDQNFRIDESSETVYLSSILDWFASDFGVGAPAQLQAIAPYWPSEEARSYIKSAQPSVEYLDYDWSLNKQPGT